MVKFIVHPSAPHCEMAFELGYRGSDKVSAVLHHLRIAHADGDGYYDVFLEDVHVDGGHQEFEELLDDMQRNDWQIN